MSLIADAPIEAQDLLALRVLYVYIHEAAEGFRWQVRAHGLENPIEACDDLFVSDTDARSAGRTALDKVCRQFRRYADAWTPGR